MIHHDSTGRSAASSFTGCVVWSTSPIAPCPCLNLSMMNAGPITRFRGEVSSTSCGPCSWGKREVRVFRIHPVRSHCLCDYLYLIDKPLSFAGSWGRHGSRSPPFRLCAQSHIYRRATHPPSLIDPFARSARGRFPVPLRRVFTRASS